MNRTPHTPDSAATTARRALTFLPACSPTTITPSVKPFRYTSCLASASFLVSFCEA
jgi:hypothetical protein